MSKRRYHPYQILEEQKRFYDSLYESQFKDINSKISETFLSNLDMPTISEEQKQTCEGEISIEELASFKQLPKQLITWQWRFADKIL